MFHEERWGNAVEGPLLEMFREERYKHCCRWNTVKTFQKEGCRIVLVGALCGCWRALKKRFMD